MSLLLFLLLCITSERVEHLQSLLRSFALLSARFSSLSLLLFYYCFNYCVLRRSESSTYRPLERQVSRAVFTAVFTGVFTTVFTTAYYGGASVASYTGSLRPQTLAAQGPDAPPQRQVREVAELLKASYTCSLRPQTLVI